MQLELYVNHNKSNDSEIAKKVRPAINCIRFLTLAPIHIARTSLLTQEEKLSVIESQPPEGDLSKMPASLSLNFDTRGSKMALPKLDLNKIRLLNDIYSSFFCNCCCKKNNRFNGNCNHAVWNCSNSNFYAFHRKADLKQIYEKYNHTFLADYEAADVRTVYDIYNLNNYV